MGFYATTVEVNDVYLIAIMVADTGLSECTSFLIKLLGWSVTSYIAFNLNAGVHLGLWAYSEPQ